MVEQDTIKLLRECDAGARMGISSIGEVMENVHSEELRRTLTECKAEHDKLNVEIQELLDEYHDEGKAPSPIAKGMSWIKTNVMLAMKDSDRTVADQPLSQPISGCRRGLQGHRQASDQP